jgi:hypothetical protein
MNKIIVNKKSLFFALIALTLFSSSTSSMHAEDKDQKENQPASDTSLVQVIRELIGLPKRVAAGGSRSNMNKSVCLITPVITKMGDYPTAIAVVPEPTIVTSKKLNEIVIRRVEGNREILYRKRASSTKAVNNILEWPLKPIQENEKFMIELRALKSSGSDKAKIILKATDAETLNKNQILIQNMKNADSQEMYTLLQKQEGSFPLKMNLLFNSNVPLKSMRDQVIKNSCK